MPISAFVRDMRAAARAIASEDPAVQQTAFARLARRFEETLAEAEAQGRRSVAGKLGGEPLTARELRPTYRRESQSYANDAVARLGQRMAQIRRQLRPELPSAITIVKEADAFIDAYADTAYRTQLSNAFNRGVRRHLEDPAVKMRAPAMRFRAVLDERVRPNHKAAHGFVALTTDPVWDQLAPPLGFNCRCKLEPVPAERVKQLGVRMGKRAPAGAGRDPHFV